MNGKPTMQQLMVGPSEADRVTQVVTWDRFSLAIKAESGESRLAVVDDLWLSPTGSKYLTIFWYQVTADRHGHCRLMDMEGRDPALVEEVRDEISEAVFARKDSIDMPEIIEKIEKRLARRAA